MDATSAHEPTAESVLTSAEAGAETAPHGEASSSEGSTGASVTAGGDSENTGPLTLDGGPSTSSPDSTADPCREGSALCLISTAPSHGDNDVPTDTHLVMQFNRRLSTLGGTLQVLETETGAVFETMDLADPRVSIDDETITVDLDGILRGETEYTVALTDVTPERDAGAPFTGIVAEDWRFTTEQSELPVADDDLVLWVDASYTSSIKQVNGTVAVLGDRSGLNNSLRQSSPVARPRLTPVTWAAHNALRFDGSDVLTAAQATDLVERYDVFVVWRSAVSPPTSVTMIFGHGVMDGVQVQLTHGHAVPGYQRAAISRFASGAFQALQFPSPEVNVTYLWNANYDGASMNLFVDGTFVTGVDVKDEPRATSEVLSLGGGPRGNYNFDGVIGELLYFRRSLSPLERRTLSEALRRKWGS